MVEEIRTEVPGQPFTRDQAGSYAHQKVVEAFGLPPNVRLSVVSEEHPLDDGEWTIVLEGPGARYEVDSSDGFCFRGPMQGQALQVGLRPSSALNPWKQPQRLKKQGFCVSPMNGNSLMSGSSDPSGRRAREGKLTRCPTGPVSRVSGSCFDPRLLPMSPTVRRSGATPRSFGCSAPLRREANLTEEEAEAWVAARGAHGTVEWIVEAEEQFLGAARLHAFDDAGGAKFAIGLLDPDGFGTETTRLIVDYAFGSLGLERLEVAVLESNERALRCYTRCGFRETRRVQGAAVIDGQLFDDIVMELRVNNAAH